MHFGLVTIRLLFESASARALSCSPTILAEALSIKANDQAGPITQNSGFQATTASVRKGDVKWNNRSTRAATWLSWSTGTQSQIESKSGCRGQAGGKRSWTAGRQWSIQTTRGRASAWSRQLAAQQKPKAAATTKIPGPTVVPSSTAANTANSVEMAKAPADSATLHFSPPLCAFPSNITSAAPSSDASATHRYRRSYPVRPARISAKAKGIAAKKTDSAWIRRS
jgi:hypothetical protein